MIKDKIKRIEKKLKALRSKSDKGASGRKKVDILNDLAYTFSRVDSTKMRTYAKRALMFARKLHYKKGVARAYLNIGNFYRRKSNYDRALTYFKKSLQINEIIANKEGAAWVCNGIGILYIDRGNYSQAMQFQLKALNIWQEIGNKKGIANAYSNIGVIYGLQDEDQYNIKYSIKAAKIFEEIGEKMGVAQCYANVGVCYDNQGDYTKALKYYLAALKMHEKIGDRHSISISYLNLGVVYGKKGDFENSLKYSQEALKIKKEIGDKKGVAHILDNIGHVYLNKKQYSEALKYFLSSFKISKEAGNKQDMASSYVYMGVTYSKQNRFETALKYLKKGLRLAQEIDAKYVTKDSYESLSEIFETQHKYAQALSFYRKYHAIEKEIFNVEKSKQIDEINTKYETEKKEKEAEIYQLKNIKLRKEMRERRKTEKELKKHRDQLEELVAERTAQLRSLAHELSLVEEKQRRKTANYLHDNIGQALSLAIFKIRSLQESAPAKNVEKELAEIKDIVAQTNQRTRSLTFEISPPVLYELGLEPAVEWLTGQFHKQYGIACDFRDDGASKPMTDETRILLFQAVRELLTNVSKHARAQTVKVSAARDGNAIRIAVEDDGTGFNPDHLGLKITHNEGFGLFNIKERLRHLGGKLEVGSKKGKGTSVVLIAPLKPTPGKTKRRRR